MGDGSIEWLRFCVLVGVATLVAEVVLALLLDLCRLAFLDVASLK